MSFDYPRTIYAIQHKPTGRIYVGSSIRLEERLRAHMCMLKCGKHSNKQMQEDYNKYGGEYEFFKLGTIEDFTDRKAEQEWMRKLRTYDPDIGYNSMDPAFRNTKVKKIDVKEGAPTPNSKRREHGQDRIHSH